MIQRATTFDSTASGLSRENSDFLDFLAERSQSLRNAARLNAMRDLLEFMLFQSDGLTLVAERIGNARRFLRSGEKGAAGYEIRALLERIRCADQPTPLAIPVDVRPFNNRRWPPFVLRLSLFFWKRKWFAMRMRAARSTRLDLTTCVQPDGGRESAS